MAYFTLNDINDVIETVEDFLKEYDIKIPHTHSDLEMVAAYEDGEPSVEIFGSAYSNLQGKLLNLFEKFEKEGKVTNVVNSWQNETDEWEADESVPSWVTEFVKEEVEDE